VLCLGRDPHPSAELLYGHSTYIRPPEIQTIDWNLLVATDPLL